MPKPIINLPEWADSSNGGNYTGGPFAGQPRKVSIPGAVAAEGFRPGADDPSAAEHVNDYLNRASLFIRWVFEGSSAGAADAHLLETDADGSFQAQRGVFFNSSGLAAESVLAQAPNAASGVALRLSSGAPNTDTLLVMTHDPGSLGVSFEGGPFADTSCHGDGIIGLSLRTDGNTADGIYVLTEGLGSDGVRAEALGTACIAISGVVDDTNSIAVQGLAGDHGVGGRFFGGSVAGTGCIVENFAGSDALVVTGGGLGTEAAVRATGKGAARGGFFTGGPSGADGLRSAGTGSGAGLLALGGPSAGNTAVIATAGAGGGTGVFATGTGASSSGVVGTAPREGLLGATSNASTGVGVRGQTAAAALSSSAAVAGEAQGTADAILGTAVNGHGGHFVGAGARATLMLDERATDPSTVVNGGLWTRQNIGLSVFRAAVVRRLFDTAGGMCWSTAGPSSGVVDNTADTILSVTLSGANAPVATGIVLVLVCLDVGRASGTPNASLDVRDQTSNFPLVGVGDELVRLYQAAGVDVTEKNVAYVVPRLLPASGPRTFTVALASVGAGNVNFRNASLSVLGVF